MDTCVSIAVSKQHQALIYDDLQQYDNSRLSRSWSVVERIDNSVNEKLDSVSEYLFFFLFEKHKQRENDDIWTLSAAKEKLRSFQCL